MTGTVPAEAELRTQLRAVEEERDYYRQVAERLGRKTLSDAQDFSRMIGNLRRGEARLRRDRDELEAIIVERTIELVKSNRELYICTSRYDELVQRIPNGVYILRISADGSMQFEYLSPQLCRILGMEARLLQQDASRAFTIAHPDDREGLESATRQATLQRVPFRWEGRFMVRDEIRWISLEADPVVTDEGDVVWNGVLSDISERRRVEERIRESEELYRHLTELAPNPITVADVSGSIRVVNPKALRLFGHEHEEEAIGRSVFEWVSPKSMESARQEFQALFQRGFITDLELYLLRNDGSEFTAEVNASLMCDAAGNPSSIILVTADITRRKHAEQGLQNRNDDMEQFIYTVSHDLRSPLVTMKAFLGYLENDMASDNRERIDQDLQYIHGAADKMKQLLDELLELSRIDRAAPQLDTMTFKEVVSSVLDVLAGAIDEHGAEIILPETDLELFGDRSRFCQVWQNLIENAIKYRCSGSVPRIEVGMRQTGAEMAFFVKDNGLGIDPQYHDKIFGLFEKLDAGSSGVGIGLAMVRRIVEKCGGRIWVESAGPFTGSCFYFTLPGAVTDEPVRPASRP